MLRSTLLVGAMLLLTTNKASADSAQPVMIMNEEPEPVQPPGIDYLGAGYDLVFGNPDGAEDASSVTDPGFRVHIVKYNWNETLNTCSGLSDEWICPREVSILPQTSCLQQSSSSMISSTKSFQRALQKDCSVKASVKGSYGGFSASASFSASSAMATMQNKIQKQKVYTFQSKAVCVDYTATLKTGIDSNTLDPLPDFVTAVNEMPLTYRSCFIPNNQSDVPCPKRVNNGFGDLPPLKTTRRLEDTNDDSSSDDVDDSVNDCGCDASVIKYFRLIQLYGTHYTTRVEMGGKIIHRIEMKQSDVSVLQKKSVDVAYGASIKASYSSMMGSASASVSAKSSTSQATDSYNAVMSVAKKEININIGGSPNEDWRQWAASTTDTPMPIRYQLAPLVDMINKVDPRKAPLFEQAVSDYISAYSRVLSFDTGKELKVSALEIQYSLLVGTMKSATFRVMIGNKGDMIPAVITVTNVTGSFQVPVPAKSVTDFEAFQGDVPITLEYISGVFTPPKAAMMEAHDAVATGHNNWVHMEAELAMKKKKKKAPAVASTATSVYFNTIQPFAVMDDKSEIPLDDQYAGKILNVGDVWSINPMN